MMNNLDYLVHNLHSRMRAKENPRPKARVRNVPAVTDYCIAGTFIRMVSRFSA